MADRILTQSDWSYGIFEDRAGPANSAYDLVNALISDAGRPFRRGGCSYLSTSDAGETLHGLASVHIAKGHTVLTWGDTGLYELDGTLAPVQAGAVTVDPPGRGERLEVMGEAVLWLPGGASSGRVTAWAGSAKAANYVTGTVAVTANSETVTGTGTAWLANVDAGMILRVGAIGSVTGTAIVKSVDSDTQITLTRPWAWEAGTGIAYALDPFRNVGAPAAGEPLTGKAVVAGRLLVGSGNRVFFTRPGILDFQTGDFHEMPSGAQVLGIAGLGPSTAVVFTTAGIFTISGLAYDPIDDSGNIQHEVSQGARDLVLWGDQGIAGYSGALVIPALDDVYLLTPEPVPVSEGIRSSYRSYVKAGHRPGTAAVYRGHYMLPIVDSSGVIVDHLVCRLDRGRAWTRFNQKAGTVAAASKVGEDEPALYGLTGQRVSDLTGCFTPEAANKQDPGVVHSFSLESRAFDLAAGGAKGHVSKVRVRYVLTDAASDDPRLVVVYATTESNGVTATVVRGGGESDGTDVSVWPINKRAERMFFGAAQTLVPCADLVIEEIEVFVRTPGGQ